MSSTPVLKGKRTSIPPAGDGLRVRLDGATSVLSDLVAGLEPACLTGADAKELYGAFVRAERFCVAAKTLLAPRIDATSIWAEEGHANAASLLAALEGVPVGQARSTLELGRHLDQLPDTAEAIREGKLSRPKAAEVIGAALLDPESEAELLAGAEELPHHQVKERCRRSRAASTQNDPVAATKRIYAEREFISWSDAEGAFCYRGRDTADRGAQILHQIDTVARRLRRQRRAEHNQEDGGGNTGAGRYTEPEKACQADAFYALVTRSGTGTRGTAKTGAGKTGAAGTNGSSSSKAGPRSRPSLDPDVDPDTLEADLLDDHADDDEEEELTDGLSLIDRPPTCSVNVRVDLAALLRGETHPGEICEIDGHGPIPPKMARDMANDSFLRFIFCESGDIRSICHFGRTINKALRTALVHRDRICVVPGCGVSYGLEIDHVLPVTENGPTTLDNLALLCHHHHFLKTFGGWTLERVDGADPEHPNWRFEPLPAFDADPGPDADTHRAEPKESTGRRPRGRGGPEPGHRPPAADGDAGKLFEAE